MKQFIYTKDGLDELALGESFRYAVLTTDRHETGMRFGALPGGEGRLHHPSDYGMARISWRLSTVGMIGGIGFHVSDNVEQITDMRLLDVNSMAIIHADTLDMDISIYTFPPTPNRSSYAALTLDATFWGDPATEFDVSACQLVVGL